MSTPDTVPPDPNPASEKHIHEQALQETPSGTAPAAEQQPDLLPLKLVLKPWTQEWLWEARGSTFIIVLTVALAAFIDVFSYSIVVPVVPFAFEQRMGIAPDKVQTLVSTSLSAYSGGLIVGSTLFGLLADKLKKRKWLMLAGLFLIMLATLVLCLAKTTWLYMLGRVFQGMSGGVVWTVGLAILADSGSVDNLAFLMGFPGIGSAVGVFFGPFLGGIVYEQAGYYAVFYVTFGVIFMDILLRFFMIEKTELQENRHKKALEFSHRDPATLTDLQKMYMERYIHEVVSDDEFYKTRQKEMQDVYGDHVTIFGKRRSAPLIISLLRYPRVLNAILLGIALAYIPACLDSTLSLHLNDLFGYNSQQSGLVFLALAIPSALGPLFGWIVDRIGPRYVVSIGYLAMMVVWILLRLPDSGSINNRVLLVALVALMGLCNCAVASPSLAEMSKAVHKLESKHPGIYGKSMGYAQACALFSVGYSLGTLLGPFHAGETRLHAGWNTMTLSVGIVCLGVAVISVFFTGGALFKKEKKEPGNELPEA